MDLDDDFPVTREKRRRRRSDGSSTEFKYSSEDSLEKKAESVSSYVRSGQRSEFEKKFISTLDDNSKKMSEKVPKNLDKIESVFQMSQLYTLNSGTNLTDKSQGSASNFLSMISEPFTQTKIPVDSKHNDARTSITDEEDFFMEDDYLPKKKISEDSMMIDSNSNSNSSSTCKSIKKIVFNEDDMFDIEPSEDMIQNNSVLIATKTGEGTLSIEKQAVKPPTKRKKSYKSTSVLWNMATSQATKKPVFSIPNQKVPEKRKEGEKKSKPTAAVSTTQMDEESDEDFLFADRVKVAKTRTRIVDDISDVGKKSTPKLEERVKIFEHVDENDNAINSSVISAKIKKVVQDQIPLSANINITDGNNPKSSIHSPVISHIESLIGMFETLTKNSTYGEGDYSTSSDKGTGMDNDGNGKGNENGTTNDLNIPMIPRCKNMQYYRIAIKRYGEFPCVLGEMCKNIYLINYHNSKCSNENKKSLFVLREFLTTSEEEERSKLFAANPNRDPHELIQEAFPKRKWCLLCNRFITHTMALRQGSGVEKSPIRIVQNHGNLFGIDGEYKQNVMLSCGQNFNGLVKPIVGFDRTHYIPHQYDVFVLRIKKMPSAFRKSVEMINEDDQEPKPNIEKKIHFYAEDSSHFDVEILSSNNVDTDFYNKLDGNMLKNDENSKVMNNVYENIKKNGGDEVVERITVDGWYESSSMVYHHNDSTTVDDTSNLNGR